MHYHLRLVTGFTRQSLQRYLLSHVNDDFIIGDGLDNDNTDQRQSVVLSFANAQDRDHVRSLMGVRGHRLAPRLMRAEHVDSVA